MQPGQHTMKIRQSRITYLCIALKWILYIGLFTCLCTSCAQIVSLSGGPKDTTPPELIKMNVLDTGTNIKPTQIQCIFNENITRINSKPIYLNPFINAPLLLQTDKHTLTLEFPTDSLKEQTTYQFDLSGVIGDQNEKNGFQHSPFRFSTGSWKDSLKCTLQLHQLALNTIKQPLIAFYNSSEHLQKQIKTQPQYLFNGSKTKVQINALKPGNYNVFVFDDYNQNRIYDAADEPCGFLPQPLKLVKDTSLNIALFLPEDRPVKIKFTRLLSYDAALIVLSRKTKVQILNNRAYCPQAMSDSLLCRFIIPKDTVTVQLFFPETGQRDSVVLYRNLKSTATEFVANAVSFLPATQTTPALFKIEFPACIQQHSVNPIYYASLKDSNLLKPVSNFKWLNPVTATFNAMDSVRYFKIDSAAFKSYSGALHKSWRHNVVYPIPEEGGNLTLAFTSTRVNENQLYELAHNTLLKSFYFKPDLTTRTHAFKKIPQGNYTLYSISDYNNDFQWTSGSIEKHSIPETRTEIKNNIRVQDAWDTEIKLE